MTVENVKIIYAFYTMWPRTSLDLKASKTILKHNLQQLAKETRKPVFTVSLSDSFIYEAIH